MPQRLLIILLLCWQGLWSLDMPAYASASPSGWSQTCFLTGENTFGYPDQVPGNMEWHFLVDSGAHDCPDVVEWEEEDALRGHADIGEQVRLEIQSNKVFGYYTTPCCNAVSRDIHKPPPEPLS